MIVWYKSTHGQHIRSKFPPNLVQKIINVLTFWIFHIDIRSKFCTIFLSSAVVNQINYFRKEFNQLFIVSMTICMNKVIISLILLKHPEHSARGRRIRGEKGSRPPTKILAATWANHYPSNDLLFLFDPPDFNIFRRPWFEDDSAKWKGTIRLWSLKERDKCPMSRANWTFNPLG